METYRIEHYIVEVETDGKKPGDTVTVTIQSERPNAKYKSVYHLVWFIGDNATDLARRAFFHYKIGTLRPDGKENIQRGIIDETGCQRYTMTLEQLQALYRQFENFVADCTQEEYNENKAAIIAVYALIHKHINNEIYK